MARTSEKTSTYLVNGRLRHDHEDYSKGDTIDLPESQADPLVELGVLLPAQTDGPDAGKPAVPSESALRKMTVANLTEYAKSVNVTVPAGATKDQIIAALDASKPTDPEQPAQ